MTISKNQLRGLKSPEKIYIPVIIFWWWPSSKRVSFSEVRLWQSPCSVLKVGSWWRGHQSVPGVWGVALCQSVSRGNWGVASLPTGVATLHPCIVSFTLHVVAVVRVISVVGWHWRQRRVRVAIEVTRIAATPTPSWRASTIGARPATTKPGKGIRRFNPRSTTT